MAPFVGSAHLGRSLLVLPLGKEPSLGYFTPMEREEAAATGLRLLTPEALDLRRWQRDFPDSGRRLAAAVGQALLLRGIPPGRLALAGQLGAGEAYDAGRALAADGFECVSGHGLMRLFRKKKSRQQLSGIRAAAVGACVAFRRVAELLSEAVSGSSDAGELWLGGEPLTVARLKGEIARALAELRLEQPAGNIVAPGEEGAVPHNSGTAERRLRRGESLVVDLYPCGELFADCTRTFCVGEPPEALVAAHRGVLQALERARDGLRVGRRAWELQKETCDFLISKGYSATEGATSGYVHGLGHGVGFELHELPSFKESAPQREAVLEFGDVLTLEPGLYDPELGFGVRLEDLWSFGSDGLENLTPLPYELDPRAW